MAWFASKRFFRDTVWHNPLKLDHPWKFRYVVSASGHSTERQRSPRSPWQILGNQQARHIASIPLPNSGNLVEWNIVESWRDPLDKLKRPVIASMNYRVSGSRLNLTMKAWSHSFPSEFQGFSIWWLECREGERLNPCEHQRFTPHTYVYLSEYHVEALIVLRTCLF